MASSLYPYLIVFLASACGLVLEIVAGRLLAPTIGVSLYTWTSIIGVVLAGISAGSFVGGLVADRYPSSKTLGIVLMAGGISALSVLPLVDLVSDATSSLPVLGRIVFMTVALFFVPSLILGMVTPLVIKLRLLNLADTGKVVGKIYAVSTSGSIFGTFITGFVLINWVGSRNTLLLVAATLVVLALAFGSIHRTKMVGIGSLVILLGLGAAGFSSGALDSRCLSESNYFCIRVDDAELGGGRQVKVLHLDQLLHSYVSIDDPLYLAFSYQQIFGEITTYAADENPSLRVLVIGGGGYTFPRYLEALYPGSTIEVIEIDPEVTKVSFEHLGLRPDTRIITYNEDARLVVPTLPEREYDLVIGDAFSQASAPYHLTTKEFNDQIKALLTDEGIYAVNVIDNLQSGNFLRSYVNTLHLTFEHVYLMNEAPLWNNDRLRTYIVIGSPDPLSINDLRNAGINAGQEHLIGNIMPQDIFDRWIASRDSIILTDDYAPVENLMASVSLDSKGLSDSERRYNAGLSYQASGQMENAIAEFDEAIQLDPGNILAYQNRGRAYGQLGQYQRAIQDYREAIRLEPLFAATYIYLGVAHGRLGEHERSLQDLGEAIRLDPESDLAYRNRGTIYLSLDRLQQAIQDFDRAIDINPLDADTHNNRGNSYVKLGQSLRAIEDYDEALRLNPQHAKVYRNRGSAHRDLGRYELAIQDYSEAIKLNPVDAAGYALRALTFIRMDLSSEAILDVEKAIAAGFPKDLLEQEIEKIRNQN